MLGMPARCEQLAKTGALRMCISSAADTIVFFGWEAECQPQPISARGQHDACSAQMLRANASATYKQQLCADNFKFCSLDTRFHLWTHLLLMPGRGVAFTF
jgi:hypothetical protein